MGCRGTDLPVVRDCEFAVAARRLRSGEAGVYIIRNGQGRSLALSTHSARARGDKAAVGRLDFSRTFYSDAFMGNRMAVALAHRCACARGCIVPRCEERVWKSR